MKAFTAIPATDPSCAIVYWGIAISQRPNPLVGPFDVATLKRGLALHSPTSDGSAGGRDA